MFKQVYGLLETYVNSEVKGAIADNFGLSQDILDGIGDVPLDTLLDVAETATDVLDKISNGNVTADDVNSLVDELTGSDLEEIVTTIADNGGVLDNIPEEVKSDVSGYIENAQIDQGLKDKISQILGIGA